MIDTKSLRKNLLSLAVTGKLTKQSEKDTPLTDDLNEYIPKMDIELPEIPVNWKYCKFDEVLINRDSERIPVSVADRKKLDKVYDYYGASGVIDKVDSYLFDETLLLIGEDGANLLSRSTPIAFLAHGKYWVNNHAHVLASTEHILLEYAEIVINSMSLVPFVTGAAQPKLSQNMMNKIAIPVPPLEEQQRIVDVVKESFKILDTIDELQRAYLSDVEVLKSKLIDAGIQGKLTEQLPEDGSAEDLFVEIQAKKQQLIKEKRIKKEKSLENISEDEIPFEIPRNWKWVRIEEIAYLTSGKPYDEVEKGELYIKVSDMNLAENETEIVTSNHYVSAANSGKIPVGSLIFPKRGGAIATNKKRMVKQKDIFVDLNTMGMTMIIPEILDYVKVWFDSFSLDDLQTGTTIPQINNKDIYPLLMPLPPISEQRRIVDKLDNILRLM